MWSWECYRSIDRTRDITLRLVLSLTAATFSGVLYFKVITKLRSSRRSPRNDALVRAFILLYIMWLAFFLPYDALELFYVTTERLTMYKGLQIVAPVEIKKVAVYGYDGFSGSIKRLAVVESVLGTARFSYGCFNSVMLLVLLKPFRKPLKKFIGWCHREWRVYLLRMTWKMNELLSYSSP